MLVRASLGALNHSVAILRKVFYRAYLRIYVFFSFLRYLNRVNHIRY